MPLKVYNTMTRDKQEFHPLRKGKVRMYVCGPTVYDSCHLGHARHGVVWDTIRRYLEWIKDDDGRPKYEVTYVVNITDIDDKIIQRANEEGVGWREIAGRYVPEYFADMASLRVRRPTHQPRASDHIPEMIEAVKTLVEKGFAYEAEGSVYFEVAKFKDYGRLSKRELDEESVARIEPDPNKRAPRDFALWKASKENEPSWDTPWGKGRPGWHIECSVMSSKYLGQPFDIHAGGADLIFPHHENEIAQAEALTGKKFVNYWLHNGFITVRDEKMSKSLGNVTGLRELVGRYTGSALRMFFLGAHYRSPIEYTEERLREAAAKLDTIYNCLETVDRRQLGSEAEPQSDTHLKDQRARMDASEGMAAAARSGRTQFKGHMDDDFNTAGALGVVFDLVNQVNFSLSEGECGPGLDEAGSILRDLISVLGLPTERERPPAGELEGQLIDALVEIRQLARQSKQYDLADIARNRLKEVGVELEDMSTGAVRVVRRVKK